MSDYPRPNLPSAPKPTPLLPDRILATVLAMIVFYSLGQAAWFVFRQPDALEFIQSWKGYLIAQLVGFGLYLWILWGVFRSRHWAFVTVLVLAITSALGGAYRWRAPSTAAGALAVAVYATVRFCGGLGPKPIRRRDLRPNLN